MAKDVIAEYVVRLGSEIDNSGVQQILNLLDSSKLKAVGLTAALGAATTAVYKFVESATKQEFELKSLARQQHKSVEAINAQNKALNAMGMTLKEINKDSGLKAIYKDLVDFNKELKLPNVESALGKIRELQGAFWKLKSSLNYAIQSIGRQVMINLEAPIKRITGYLNSASDWVKNNLNSITSKVGSVITAFAKGVIGIGETIGKIFNWIGQMPAGIKSIATAITLVIGLLNSGPLGRIFALISLIGDVIHDAEVYLWNKDPANAQSVAEYGEVPTALTGLWDIIFGGDSTEDKAYDATKAIFNGINRGLEELITSLDTTFIEGWLEEPTGIISQILSGVSAFFSSDEGSGQLSDVFINAFNAVLSLEAFAGRLTSEVVGKLGEIFGAALGNKNFSEGITKAFNEDNTIAGGILNGILTAIVTKGNIGAALGAALTTVYKEAQIKAENDNDPLTDPNDWQSLLGIASDDFTHFAEGILQAIVGALGGVNVAAGSILSAISQTIVKAIAGSDESAISGALNEAIAGLGGTSIFGAFGTTLGTTIITGGNFGLGIITGIATYLSDLASNVGSGEGQYSSLWEAIKADAGEFWSKIQDIWYGPLEMGIDEKTGHSVYRRNGNKGIWSILKPILWGDDNETFVSTEIIRSLDDNSKLVKAQVNAHGGILSWLLGYNTTDTDGREVHVAGIGERLFDSIKTAIVGEGGLKDMINGLFSENGALSPVVTALTNAFTTAFEIIKSQLPDWLLNLFNLDPNSAPIAKQNPDGSVTLSFANTKTSTTVSQATASAVQDAGLKMQKAKTLFGLTTTPSGLVLPGMKDFTAGLEGNDAGFANIVMSKLSSLISQAVESDDVEGLTYLSQLFSGYQDRQGSGEKTIPLLREMFTKLKEYDVSGIPVPIEADTEKAKQQIKDLENVSVTIEPVISYGGSNEKTTEKQAFGGRIGHRMDNVTVGEDGTEYIIPITKSERAATLIKQMFNEMGSSAVNSIISGLGLGESGTNGASLASVASAVSGMTMANTYNINAPVNINVNSSGADAKEIGSTVYNLAERNLIKNVMGVYA